MAEQAQQAKQAAGAPASKVGLVLSERLRLYALSHSTALHCCAFHQMGRVVPSAMFATGGQMIAHAVSCGM